MAQLPPGVGTQIMKYLRHMTIHHRDALFAGQGATAHLPGQILAEIVRSRDPADRLPVWLTSFANKASSVNVANPHGGPGLFIPNQDGRTISSIYYNRLYHQDDVYQSLHGDTIDSDFLAPVVTDDDIYEWAVNTAIAEQHLIDSGAYSKTRLNKTLKDGADGVVLYFLHKYPRIRSLLTVLSLLPSNATELVFNPMRWALGNANYSLMGISPAILSSFINTLDSIGEPGDDWDAGGTLRNMPALREALRDMQNPTMLAVTTLLMYRIAYNISPTVQLRMQLRVLTRRESATDAVPSFRVVTVPLNHNEYIVVDSSTSINDLANKIYKGAIRALIGDGQTDSEHNDREDAAVIVGVKYRFVDGVNPSPLMINLGPTVSPDSIQRIIRNSLASIAAFAYPPHLFNDAGRLSIATPSVKQRLCILQAFCHIRLILNETFKPRHEIALSEAPKYYKALARTIEEFIDDVRMEHPVLESGEVYGTLNWLMMHEREWFGNHDQTGILYMVFFGGYNRCVPFPSLKITYEPGMEEIAITVPANNKYYFSEDEVADVEYTLVYYQGHVFPSTMGQFRQCISLEDSEFVRVNTRASQRPPPPYVLDPVDHTKKLEVRNKEEAKQAQYAAAQTAKGRTINPLSVIHGCFDTTFNIDKVSCDLETGSCPYCSSQDGNDGLTTTIGPTPGADIQDAFACSVAWGTGDDDVKNFVGHECPVLANESNFEEYGGCVTQMLRWLRDEWGWYHPVTSRQHAPCCIRERWIHFFNGARFDMFFIFRALVYWHEPVEVMMLGSEILKIKWGNYIFMDFAKLYPHYSLDKCYKLFSGYPEVRNMLPKTGKWKAFPYNLIRPSMFDRELVPIEEMSTNDALWGGKRADVAGDEELTLAQCNAKYWAEHICAEGFKASEHLAEYCAEDVRILQLCVYVHTKFLAVGTASTGRWFNVNRALTCSSASFDYFRQAYLEETFTTPDLLLALPVIDPLTNAPVSLTNLLRFALHGGKTDCFNQTLPYTEEELEMLKAAGKTPLYDDHDVNSMYPYIMHEYEMPVEMTEYETISTSAEGQPVSEFVDQWLYHVSVKYPPKESGIIVKVDGYCIAPNFVPFTYIDPSDKNITTFTMVFGVELNEAVRQGAEVRCKFVIKFRTAPIFKRYIRDLYDQRVATNDPLLKLVLKFRMNSTAGKFAQAPKTTPRLIANGMDDPLYSDDEVLIGIEDLFPTHHGHRPLLAHVLGVNSHCGQANYVDSFITAGGRARICRIMYEMKTRCVDMVGKPVVSGYCDTDSCKHRYMDYTTDEAPLCNKQFAAEYIHPTKLGMLKSETVRIVDGVEQRGLDLLTVLRKKVIVMHLHTNTEPLLEGESTADREKRDKNYICKSKGLPHKNVLPSRLEEIHRLGTRGVFEMPMSFRRSLRLGIIKEEGLTRSIVSGNSCRMPPEEDGFMPPFPDVDAFLISRGRTPHGTNP